jgi:hypothetical protein
MWLMGWLMSVGTDACMRVHEMLQGIRGAGPAESRAGRGGDVSYVQYTRNTRVFLSAHARSRPSRSSMTACAGLT